MAKSKAPLDVRWSRELPSTPSSITLPDDTSCPASASLNLYHCRSQRRLSKKASGSKNRARARLKVARLHAKIADCRMDALHKTTRKLINENQIVCVKSLKVKNMIRNPSLFRAIANAGWGEFTRHLRHKGEWAGRTEVAIDPFFPSSKRCSYCGFTMKKMPLDVRKWSCPECGADHDRNIKAAGLGVLAHGEPVNLESLNTA